MFLRIYSDNTHGPSEGTLPKNSKNARAEKDKKMVLGQNVFVSRIPVLDAKSRTNAYEIEFFGVSKDGESTPIERIRRDSPLSALLDAVDPDKLLGDRKAIVRAELDEGGFPVAEKWQKRLILQVPWLILATGKWGSFRINCEVKDLHCV